MEKVDHQYEVKKLKTVSWITFAGTLISFFVCIQSIGNNPTWWRIACAVLAFLSIAAMSGVTWWRLQQVQLEAKKA